MKKNIFILIFLLFTINSTAQTPYYSEGLGAYILNSEIYKGDTIAVFTLKEVPIYPAPKFKNKKQEKFYWKTVRDVKKVYPYMKFIGAEYKREPVFRLLFAYFSAMNSTPSVPGPQWLEMTPPARVMRISSKQPRPSRY